MFDRPRISCGAWWVGEHHAAFLTESRTRSRGMEPRTGNPGRCGPCNGTANSFLERETNTMAVSRREFLNRVGRAGGYSAAFLMMQGMGLMPAAAARPEPAEPGSGKGVKAVILGGGIAGLVATYELRALGYECTLLESRPRPGRKKLDGPPWRQNYVSGRNHADLLMGRGALSEFWTGAAALCSSHHAGLLSKAGGAARGGGEYVTLRLPAKR